MFHNMVHGYAAYEQLLREQERNHMIYEKILNGQKKSEMFGATSAWYLYCYAGCGLMYFKTERGGFVGLGADKTYNIYRYADLATYEEIDGNSSIDKRMENGKPYIHLMHNERRRLGTGCRDNHFQRTVCHAWRPHRMDTKDGGGALRRGN